MKHRTLYGTPRNDTVTDDVDYVDLRFDGSKDNVTYQPVAAHGVMTPGPGHPKRKLITTILTDFAVLALSLAFVVFVVLVSRLNGSEIHDSSMSMTSWENAITILATLFPILFASVTSRSMSQLARWRLQQGATVGFLEQLLGSRTVGSTVTTLAKLRSFNVLTILLLAIWAASPLGTQALLRMLGSSVEPQLAGANVVYFDSSAVPTVALSVASTPNSYNIVMTRFRTLGSLYMTLLLTPARIKSDTMDLWGNIRIPYLRNNTDPNWRDLPLNSSEIEYSSLAGLPVNAVQDGNSTFLIESSYVKLDCTKVDYAEGGLKLADSEVIQTPMLANVSYAIGVSGDIYHLPNGTWHGYNTTRSTETETSWSLALDRFVAPIWQRANKTIPLESDVPYVPDEHSSERNRPVLFRNETGIDAGPTTLVFETACIQHFSNPSPTLRGYCGVTQEYVESRVACSSDPGSTSPTCRVVAQRPSQKRNAPGNISFLSFANIFAAISREMPLTTGTMYNFQIEPSLYYLQDPYLRGMSKDTCFTANITAETLGPRLGQLINTYLTLSQLYLQERNDVTATNSTASAETSNVVVLFAVSRLWAVLCLVSGAALCFVGVVGVVCKHWATGPEVLGYVSTVFRDSRHIEISPEASRLDGIDLSRQMKNVEIRYGVTGVTGDGDSVIGVGLSERTEKARLAH